MSVKLSKYDAIADYRRRRVAARRVGEDSRCACGEKRPEALIAGSDPIICAACQRLKEGRSIMDNHHVAGRSNSPLTIPLPVNDHRAALNSAQADWPKETRENPDGCPLLAGAARIRGFRDTIHFLADWLLGAAELLELLHRLLVKRWGAKWWRDTPFERFAPKR